MNPLTVLQKQNKKQNKSDLHIWFRDSNKDVVTARYYSQEFLGKSSANDTCSHFEQCLGLVEKEKLQVSSDGPNMNLKLVSAIFNQIFIFSSSDRPSKTMKNDFYFILKALFVLEIFKFL